MSGYSARYLTPNEVPEGYRTIALVVPTGLEWEALVRGALATLLVEENWQEYGAISVEDTLQYFLDTLLVTMTEWADCS